MLKRRLGPMLIGLLLLSACDVDPTQVAATATGGLSTQAVQDQAPIISEVIAKPDASGNVLLAVHATDPGNKLITFAWSASAGQLSATTGPSVLWRPPKQAGTFSAVVTVTNALGLKRSATQQFTVSADGQAQSTGQAAVSVATAGTTASASGATGASGTGATSPNLVPGPTASVLPVVQSGQFQIPSPVPFTAASPVIVAGASAIPAATPGPTVSASPFSQPVATPIPGPSPTPTPGQPIATPTPTPPPASPLPSAVPTPPPPTPQPGVPQPPDSVWVQVNPANVPTGLYLNAVNFPFDSTGAFNEGWAVGAQGMVIHTGNSGQSWDIRNSGVANNFALTEVVFTAGRAAPNGANFDEAGFAAGASKVYRCVDYNSWQDISPGLTNSNFSGTVKSLVVYNAKQVLIVTDDGQVWRTDNANGPTAGGVTWTPVDTKPPTRPNDATSNLCAGAAFPASNDLTLGWFTGDNLYRYDSDGSPDWSRKLSYDSSDRPNSAIEMTSLNNIWVGTNSGAIYHSSDAGNNWSKIAPMSNRYHNGTTLTLTPGSVGDISFADDTNGWVLGLNQNVYDTRDTGATWAQTRLPAQIFDLQVEARLNTTTNKREFFGWGVGPNGTVLRYIPAQ